MNLGKNIAGLLKLSQTFWRNVGQRIVQEIRKDMTAGLFQNDASNLRYMSKQYVKYKSRTMRGSSGRRVSQYATAIESTNTAYVDMTLTGKLKRGLRIKEPTENGIWIGFEPKDTGKILGNEKRGRLLRGLNTKNKKIVKQAIVDEFKKNKQTLPKNISININL